MNWKHTLSVVGQALTILAFGVVSIWVLSFVIKKTTSEKIAQDVVKEIIVLRKPQCPSSVGEYEKTKQENQVLQLVKNINSYGGLDGYFRNMKLVVVNRKGSGSEIACGYLYIKAGTKNNPLTAWENLYIKPGQFGGHIEDNSAITINKKSNRSEMLFNLSSISYREKRSDNKVYTADWASLLNVSNRTEFDVALNTTNTTGIIEEANIVYKCWNPETGSVNNDCKLEVANF